MLVSVSNREARVFYEIEAARENWSIRELERRVSSMLFEPLAKNREKDEALALA